MPVLTFADPLSLRNGRIIPASTDTGGDQGFPCRIRTHGENMFAGAILSRDGMNLFRVAGSFLSPACGDDDPAGQPDKPRADAECVHSFRVYLLKSLVTEIIPTGEADFRLIRDGFSLAWITLSDKGSKGEREDKAGPLIGEIVSGAMPVAYSRGFMLGDELNDLKALLVSLALEQKFDLIVTTGGTGVAERDITPEATLSVIDRRLPGMETAMLMLGLSKTAHASISRAVVGTLRKSLIINLPGSPKAVSENLQAILPALPHTLKKLAGDASDCAQNL